MPREIESLVRNQVLSLGLVPAIANDLSVSESLVQAWFNPKKVNHIPLWAGETIIRRIREAGGLDPILPLFRRAAEDGEKAREQELLRFPPHRVGGAA